MLFPLSEEASHSPVAYGDSHAPAGMYSGHGEEDADLAYTSAKDQKGVTFQNGASNELYARKQDSDYGYPSVHSQNMAQKDSAWRGKSGQGVSGEKYADRGIVSEHDQRARGGELWDADRRGDSQGERERFDQGDIQRERLRDSSDSEEESYEPVFRSVLCMYV
jgi:hypothetical protein